MAKLTSDQALIYSKISDVMKEIEAIGKTGKNVQQNYKFRGIDDVYNSIHQVLAKHGIFTVPEVINERSEQKITKSETVLIYRILTMKYHFFASDGSSVTATVIGEGMDSGDKASNKAMSVAHKYALMQVFCIPTEEPKDPEHDSHEIKNTSHIFTGTPDQKLMLYKIFQKLGITDIDKMKNYTSSFIESKAARLQDLENIIKETEANHAN